MIAMVDISDSFAGKPYSANMAQAPGPSIPSQKSWKYGYSIRRQRPSSDRSCVLEDRPPAMSLVGSGRCPDLSE
jgi:hypothetical protein